MEPSSEHTSSSTFRTASVIEAVLAEASGAKLTDVEDAGGRLTFTLTGVPVDFDLRIQLDQVIVRGLAVMEANARYISMIRRAQQRRAGGPR